MLLCLLLFLLSALLLSVVVTIAIVVAAVLGVARPVLSSALVGVVLMAVPGGCASDMVTSVVLVRIAPLDITVVIPTDPGPGSVHCSPCSLCHAAADTITLPNRSHACACLLQCPRVAQCLALFHSNAMLACTLRGA